MTTVQGDGQAGAYQHTTPRCPKVAYHSREVAEQWLTILIRQGKLRSHRDGRPMHAYRCEHCRQFHLGHKPPWQTLRKLREANP